MRKEDPREELIEGRNPVLEAVRAGLPLSEILVASGSRGKEIETLIALAGAGNIPVSYRERVYLDRLSKTGRHQGVIARGSLPATRSLDHLFAAAESRGETPLFLLAAGVEDPRNLGSIIRTAEVAGPMASLCPNGGRPVSRLWLPGLRPALSTTCRWRWLKIPSGLWKN